MDKSKRLVFNALSSLLLMGGGSLNSSCSSGAVERNYVCDNSGCHLLSEESESENETGDENGKYTNDFWGSTSHLETGFSSSSGKATVLGEEIIVVDEEHFPLRQIKVYGLENPAERLFLAVDQTGAHYPSFLTKRTDTLESSLKLEGALISDEALTLVLEAIEWGKKIMTTFLSTEGDFLEAGKAVNYYCMTASQMKNNYILIPAGILVLSSPEGFSSKILKIAEGVAVNEIFNKFIHSFYGEHEGYLVAVPKTATNLCENNLETVCSITTKSLSQELWSKQGIPYWEIKGTCIPKTLNTSEDQGYSQSSQRSRQPQSTSTDNCYERTPCNGNDENNDWKEYDDTEVIIDEITGLFWQKMPSLSTMTRKEAKTFCINQNIDNYDDWRLPYKNELKTIMNGSGSCLLPSEFEGPCDRYWAADDTCVYADEPQLRVNFFPNSYQFECVSKGTEAYVRCVRN